MSFTEAARRILKIAALLAEHDESVEICPRHLLGAILEDESRGSELLAESGLTLELFRDQWNWSSPQLTDQKIPNRRLSEDSELVIDCATTKAFELSRDGELGSEHLLWGLLNVESQAGDFLDRFAVTASDLAERLSAVARVETTPIVVTETLRTTETPNSQLAEAWRIIDAAANRCSEGVRVIEDVVRFGSNDGTSSRRLKEWRHEFNQLIEQFPLATRLEMRDTTGDVGTTIRTRSEQQRGSLNDLLLANFKRTQEAIRSLEETAKLLGPQYSTLPVLAEALRYRLYMIEKTVLRQRLLPKSITDAKLYLLVTQALCCLPPEDVIQSAIVNGVDVIQLREKTLDDRAYLAYARDVRKWTHAAGTLLIVNDRPDIAALCAADGVHLGQEDFTVAEARKILGPGKLIGVSTHQIEQARRAVNEGADYLGAGPTFPSQTKTFEDDFSGEAYLREVASEIEIPWFAIGGIDASNVDRVLATGCRRVAVCGTICCANEPGRVAAELSQQL